MPCARTLAPRSIIGTSSQELLLSERHLNVCMQNLAQRLQEARSLGMQLSIPDWVTNQLRDLDQLSEEEWLRGEVQS